MRELIKLETNFKKRFCWNCGKDLNIYDFISDNINFTPEYILKLWQASILEFHCCECFRNLKKNELEEIEKILATRYCEFCKKSIDVYKFSKINNYLKIYEIKTLWLDEKYKIFCDNLCQRKYHKTYSDFLKKSKLKKQNKLINKN
ncbi:MAG: hypothetical protein ACFE85_04915 [Candidatus Hodarchaeota archaeon]